MAITPLEIETLENIISIATAEGGISGTGELFIPATDDEKATIGNIPEPLPADSTLNGWDNFLNQLLANLIGILTVDLPLGATRIHIKTLTRIGLQLYGDFILYTVFVEETEIAKTTVRRMYQLNLSDSISQELLNLIGTRDFLFNDDPVPASPNLTTFAT